MAPRRRIDLPTAVRQPFSGRCQRLYEEAFKNAWQMYGCGFGPYSREEFAHNVGVSAVHRLGSARDAPTAAMQPGTAGASKRSQEASGRYRAHAIGGLAAGDFHARDDVPFREQRA